MIRAAVITASAVVAAFGLAAPVAMADPVTAGATAYMFGACYTPDLPVVEQPGTIMYGCDGTSVMQDMSWTSWGADGATGTGTDNSVECQPNCAQGRRLLNPIIVHAWNPLPPKTSGCPAGVDFYSDYTVAYPQDAPPWVKPGTSWAADVDYIYVDGMPAVHFKDQKPLSCSAAAVRPV
ncbi:hypothetical protein [Mycolicibacterium komossense]|uniref:Secreted protein n=1 Tax=Mycolicibacterium komossense TaxID=1779 RepID=A0ABT3CA37_9MYCO|nr:hypothetical protein [Mycolicibacterium komossense]MCV7226333.1 hypothetical protein [Mycolicibacterium komossense]